MTDDREANLHPLLNRQLKRESVSLDALEKPAQRLLQDVNRAYRAFDNDRLMIERSMELSSEELLETNADLRSAIEALKATEAELQEAKNRLEERVLNRTAELMRSNEELHREISERIRKEEQLAYLASHDALTGLPNRRAFFAETERVLERCRSNGTSAAMIYLDLDQFKDVNDTWGHPVGDELLVKVADSILKFIPEDCFLARIGGDEFAILVPDARLREANLIADDLLANLSRTSHSVAGRGVTITCSLGITQFGDDGRDATDIFGQADQALFQAKTNGRNRFEAFRSRKNWRSLVEARVLWQNRILEGLRTNSFVLFLQPIVNLRTGDAVQYEILLRLQTEAGLVRPGQFIAVAERSGLSFQIDRWVAREAIKLIGEFRDSGRQVKLAVNLSAKAMEDPVLLSTVQAALERERVDSSQLSFEITESAAVSDLGKAGGLIRSLQRLGCTFALDDFGAGFSSFRQLKYLPVDYLKIDGDFVRRLSSSTVDQGLVQAFGAMANALGKTAVAEFVSDMESIAILTRYGIELGQGYFLGRPVEAHRVLHAAESRTFAQAG